MAYIRNSAVVLVSLEDMVVNCDMVLLIICVSLKETVRQRHNESLALHAYVNIFMAVP